MSRFRWPADCSSRLRALGSGIVVLLLAAAGLVVFGHRDAGESSSAVRVRDDALRRARVTHAAPQRNSLDLGREPGGPLDVRL